MRKEVMPFCEIDFRIFSDAMYSPHESHAALDAASIVVIKKRWSSGLNRGL